MKRMKFHNYEKLHRRHLKDPAFKEAWDQSEAEDKLIRALIDARLSKKMSQKRLAEKLGTKQSAVSRFESGRVKNPTISSLYDMARALGVRIVLKVEPGSKKI